MAYTLRDYQEECRDAINRQESGSHLAQLATALGKTVIFTHPTIRRRGKLLVLAHHKELIEQPAGYFKKQGLDVGIEMAEQRSHGEDIVVACVPSIKNRLNNFASDEFDMIITDECHHAAAKSYQQIYDHFKPRVHIGFTATPNRGDKVRLDGVFDDIIFQRDICWGIENGYLSDITARRVHIDCDLRNVSTRNGDYAIGELEKAMAGTADAVADAYYQFATGATLIFAVSVDQANAIASKIKGSVVVTGETDKKERQAIIDKFTDGEIPCIVNVMVFAEGVDIPRIETIIIARPTQSETLYTQMVGRGLRLWEGKEKLSLIDCVGVTGKLSPCTAPTLLGIDMDLVPESKRDEVQGDFFELELKADAATDTPESWIRDSEIVNMFEKQCKFNARGINWTIMPDQSFLLKFKDKYGRYNKIEVSAMDKLGYVTLWGSRMPVQSAMDDVYNHLLANYSDSRVLWDSRAAKKAMQGKRPSDKQMAHIKGDKRCRNFDASKIDKYEASQILGHLFA